MSEPKLASTQLESLPSKDETPRPKHPKPPYDTPENRACYNVQSEGLFTRITRKFSFSECLETLRARLRFKIDVAALQQLWKFYKLVFMMSPLRVSLQLLGTTIKKIVPVTTSYLTARLMSQAYQAFEHGRLNRRELAINAVLVTLAPLVGFRITKSIRDNEAALGFKLQLDVYSQDDRTLFKEKFGRVHSLMRRNESFSFMYYSVQIVAEIVSIITSATLIAKVALRKDKNRSFLALALVAGGVRHLVSVWSTDAWVKMTDPTVQAMERAFTVAYYNPNSRKEVKLLGLQTVFTQRFKKLAASLGSDVSAAKETNLGDIPEMLEAVMAPVMIVSYAWQAQHKSFKYSLPSITEFEFIRSAAKAMSQRIWYLVDGIRKISDQVESIQAFWEIGELTPLVQEPENPIPFSSTQKESQGMEIEFRNVSFKYPDAEEMVLKHVNLKIKPGQLVALVGDNGAGKSTLINVLTRLYDVTEGEILVNGVEIKNFLTADLHSHMVAMFQSTARMNLRIKDFISVGSEPEGLESVEQAAKQAGCHDLIMGTYAGYDSFMDQSQRDTHTPESFFRTRMHHDYQTKTGKDDESWYSYDKPAQEVKLSGGQWQKLALARAFFIKNARLRIYDEFSKELDSIAERDAFRQIWKTRKETNSTVIYVTHKYTSVPWADLILCMKDGELVEAGTHAELLALKGHYYTLYQVAASGMSKDESYVDDTVSANVGEERSLPLVE